MYCEKEIAMSINKYLLLIFVFVIFISQRVVADKKPEKIFDLRTISCQKFLSLNEQSRDYLFFFLYGFSSGVLNDYEHSVESIEKAVEASGNTCSDNPKMKVIDVLNSINNP